MKNIIIFIIVILVGIFFLKTFGIIGTQENHIYTTETQTDTIEESPKKTYIDSPKNTYDSQVEAQSISNSINPVGTYLDSRVATRGDAKESVKESNKQTEEQNKAIEDFLK